MAYPDEQVQELKAFSSEISECTEAGMSYILLKNVCLPAGCSPDHCDLLLCPGGRDGYPSRLFFAQQIAGRTNLNWNSNNVRILERNWCAYSWKLYEGNLRLAQILVAHLRAFQ